jgi:eukaryotic-like serine/threonine-protein kinase
VSPHVRLVQLLRMGAVGSVWAAYHGGLGKKVAVKFMSASLSDDKTTVTRFSREGAFIAKIGSPHVVEIYEQGLTEDGLPYMVMELLQGEDLSERMERSGSLSLDETGTMIAQLCDALGEAHALGIIHRDIRPNNVFLVDGRGEVFVKLLDFGVARGIGYDTGAVTGTGDVVGTVVYMSPEQFYNSKGVDGRADLWSVAVVAYRALTGEHPFTDTGLEALLAAVRSGVFPLPSQRRGGIPVDVDEWVKKALQRDPNERFQTAREMADGFSSAMRRKERTSTLKPSAEAPKPAAKEAAAPAAQDAPAPVAGSEGGVRSGVDYRFLLAVGLALLLGTAAAYVGLSGATRDDGEPRRAAPAPTASAPGSASAAPADRDGARRDGTKGSR